MNIHARRPNPAMPVHPSSLLQRATGEARDARRRAPRPTGRCGAPGKDRSKDEGGRMKDEHPRETAQPRDACSSLIFHPSSLLQRAQARPANPSTFLLHPSVSPPCRPPKTENGARNGRALFLPSLTHYICVVTLPISARINNLAAIGVSARGPRISFW